MATVPCSSRRRPTGTSATPRADPGDYRPPEELAAWLELDPIPRQRSRLLNAGHDEAPSTTSKPARLRAIEAAADKARSAPDPPVEAALTEALDRRRSCMAEQLTYREAVARGNRPGDAS